MIYRNPILLLIALLMLAAVAACDSPMDIDTARRRVLEQPPGKETVARIRPRYFTMTVEDMINARVEDYYPRFLNIEIDTTYAPPHLYIHRLEGVASAQWYGLFSSFQLRCDSLVPDRPPTPLVMPYTAQRGLEIVVHTDMVSDATETLQADGSATKGSIVGMSNSGAPAGCTLELRLQASGVIAPVSDYDYKVTMTMQY